MTINLCRACHTVIPADAERCGACGADVRPRDRQASAEREAVGALWLDDLAWPPVAPAAAPVAAQAQAAPDSPMPAITLRDVGTPPRPAAVAVRKSPPAPTDETLVGADPEPMPPVVREGSAGAAGGKAPADVGAELAAKKAARRAVVRRSLLRNAAAAQGAGASAAAEVLVLDADARAREQLTSLLQGFGFGVMAVDDAAKARALAAARPFAAAFLDITLDATDGGAGIDLCRHVHAVSDRRGGPATLLVLVASQLRPIDRVRAELAGCGEAILKPVTRGSVARVLDTHGIVLPSDARRG